MLNRKITFSSFSLKIIALVLMTIDHIGAFIAGMPFFLRMLGRVSAPLFFFTFAHSFQNTSSRKRFILRVYVASVVIELLKILVFLYDSDSKYAVQCNIFASLFLVLLISTGIEGSLMFFKSNDRAKALLYLALILIPVVRTFINSGSAGIAGWVIKALVPSLLEVEGEIPWVILGVGMCLTAKRKTSLIWFYALYCAFELLGTVLIAGIDTLLVNIQWMMIFALPFMFLYNGDKGKSVKWFFYIYYPVHIWLLYFIGHGFCKIF